MQSKENAKNKQEETPGAEEVTISLEEYSKMKKRLRELGAWIPACRAEKEKKIGGGSRNTTNIQLQSWSHPLSFYILNVELLRIV